MSNMTAVAIEPADAPSWMADAVRDGGGIVAPLETAEGLVWFEGAGDVLAGVLSHAPQIRWVELCHAGIESYREAINADRIWSCAKGAFSSTVAEQAVGLILGVLRNFVASARRPSWQRTETRQLKGSNVLIIGGGGIGQSLTELLRPFQVNVTIVGRTVEPREDGVRTVTMDQLDAELDEADVVVIALPLTDETRGLIDARRLRAMRSTAILINVARGDIVVAEDLIQALEKGWIAGAGLEVTAPEPLPDDSPLWQTQNVLITSHSANSPHTFRTRVQPRIRENVGRRARGEELVGLVDPVSRY